MQQSPTLIVKYEAKQKFKVVKEEKQKPFDYFILSPNDMNMQAILVTKHNDSNDIKRKGSIRIFMDPDLTNYIFEKEFEGAHELEIKWSQDSKPEFLTLRLIRSYHDKKLGGFDW
jgi:L-ascorbate metabolism protein UlaG (beta-lactamase superfamily)